MDWMSTLPTPSRMMVSNTGQDQVSLPQPVLDEPPGVPL